MDKGCCGHWLGLQHNRDIHAKQKWRILKPPVSSVTVTADTMDGLRYTMEPARSGCSLCHKCHKPIAFVETRIGSSQKDTWHDAFFWKHPHCFTGKELVNVKSTYYAGNEEPDYSKIPGWSLIPSREQIAVAAAFDALRPPRERPPRSARPRRAAPAGSLDWRALLRAGELDGESAAFLKEVLRPLGLPLGGKRPDLLARLRAYAGAAGPLAEGLPDE